MYKFNLNPKDVKKINTSHRRILTKIPHPESIDNIKKCYKYEPISMSDQLPVVWDYAKDFYVFDKHGNKWIDLTSCIFLSNVGHSHEKIKSAIQNCINKNLIASYHYPTEERADFLEYLIKNTPSNFEKALLLCSGTEAVEASLKMSIKFTKKNKIIAFENSYHGKTMGSQMVCGKPSEYSWVPVDSNVKRFPFPYEWKYKNKNDLDLLFENTFGKIDAKKYAAVITEPYQGWCAAFIPVYFAKKIQNWCKKNNVLLIVDEIQSGFGRTGKLFAYEHIGVDPDIITCGKGISSSLPLSAVLTRSEIIDIDSSFTSTHGGNPVACAASKASLEALIEDGLIEESRKKGIFLKKLLEEWKKEKPDYISKVYCKGLLASVFINSPNKENDVFVDKLIEIAMQKGVLSVRTASGTLKIGPPLSITKQALKEAIDVLKESLEECLGT